MSASLAPPPARSRQDDNKLARQRKSVQGRYIGAAAATASTALVKLDRGDATAAAGKKERN